MTLPVGVQTKTLNIGRPFDALGNSATLRITVTPVFGGTAQRLVWAATSDTFEVQPVTPPGQTDPDGDTSESIDLPVVDQAGWLDGSGNAITNWSYQVSVTPTFTVRGVKTKMKTYTKFVSPLSTDSSPIDMDRIPDGTAADPILAPGPAVSEAELTAHITDHNNPHAVTKAQVGLGSVDNTSDASKPVSIAQQTALNAKAPLASPTFTGTVSGVSKAMVGLGNVDNTSDASKPVSTAQAAAIAAKAGAGDLRAFGIHSPANYGATMDGVADDTTAVQAALTAIAAGPVGADGKARGTLKIPPQASVTLTTALRVNIENTHFVIEAYGADIRQTNTSAACLMEFYTTSSASGQPRPSVYGGQWTHTSTATDIPVFIVHDVRGAKFRDVKFTGYVGIQVWNDTVYCERTDILDCEDRSCTVAIDFIPGATFDDGGNGGTKSFARTNVRNLKIQGGVANMPKIRCRGAVYDATFDGIYGNINDDVTVMYLSGAMRGTEIRQVSVEANNQAVGHTNTGTLFEWGTFTGIPPTIVGNLNMHNNILLEKGTPPTNVLQPWKVRGVLTIGDGKVSTPSYSFISDPTTGFYSGGAGVMSLGLSGTKLMDWSAANGMSVTAAAATTQVLRSKATADSAQRFQLRADGFQQWGDGTNSPDVTFRRRTTSTLEVGGALEVTGTLTVAGASVVPLAAARTTDHAAVNNSTTLVTDDVLTFAVLANSVYIFDGVICFDATATADMKVGFTSFTGSSGYWVPNNVAATSSGVGVAAQHGRQALTSTVTAGGAGAGTIDSLQPRGVLITGSTAGTFALQYAQNVAEATDLIVRAGSYLRLTKVS